MHQGPNSTLPFPRSGSANVGDSAESAGRNIARHIEADQVESGGRYSVRLRSSHSVISEQIKVAGGIGGNGRAQGYSGHQAASSVDVEGPVAALLIADAGGISAPPIFLRGGNWAVRVHSGVIGQFNSDDEEISRSRRGR